MPFSCLLGLIIGLALSGPGLNSSDQHRTRLTAGNRLSSTLKFNSTDILIDTVSVRAFAGAVDRTGTIYAVLATPEPLVKVYRSIDTGLNWENLLNIPIRSPARQIELLTPDNDSGYIYIFILDSTSAGDLYLLRLTTKTGIWQMLPVALGPDTIDRFTVTADRSPRYYLYCLYVNQHQTGANGKFTRSLDCGLTWEPAQDFYNCLDPCLFFGSGSVLHCVWRFGLNGREIHYARNRHFGLPGRWDRLQVLSNTAEKCFDPQVVQADTSPPWRAPVWVAWTIAHRDTELLDIAICYSTDGGNSFTQPATFGEPFIDEWWPGLTTSSWSAYLVYNAGARGVNDPTVVYYQYSRFYAPGLWSSPIKINDPRVNATVYAARPRILPNGALFSYYGNQFARGLFFRRLTPAPNNNLITAVPKSTGSTPAILDITGRKISLNRTRLRPGVYFVLTENRIQKQLILK
jgi:hypothetical protein